MDRNPPIETLRDSALKISIWQNTNDQGDAFFTATVAKTYEDRNGNLQDGQSFSQNDLLRVAELAREAHGAMRDLRRDLQKEQKQANTPEREDRPQRFRRGAPKRSEPGLER